jgi:predicted dehydrogenase
VSAPEAVGYEDALARTDVDAVLIGVPDHLHLPITLAALKAGKHVFMEKPTTHALDEGARLIAAVRQSGKVCQTGTQQRSGAHYARAKAEYFDQGKLGKVIFVRASWSDFPWQRRTIAPQPRPAGLDWDRFLGPAKKVPYDWVRYDSWRYFPDYGGGLLADILTHWVDVAQWFLNETKPISAVATGGIYQLKDGRENPDTVSAVLQYGGGWNLNFESTVLPVATPRPSVFFQGTEGSLDIARDGYVFRPNKGAPVEQQSSENLELAHVTNFLDAVKDGRRPSADIEIGVQACDPVHLAKAAYWRKKRMRFDPSGSRIEEDI